MKFCAKDGYVYESVIDAIEKWCPCTSPFDTEHCQNCGFSIAGGDLTCEEYAAGSPRTAARIMGYEIIEDDEDTNVPVKNDHNQPHICKQCVWEDTGECADCKGNDKFKPTSPTATIFMSMNNQSMTRASILESARRCVCGDREQDYGSPENNFQTIANLWMDYLQGRGYTPDIEPKDVACMMALVKIARIASGHAKADNWIDGCGYLACGGEICARSMENS